MFESKAKVENLMNLVMQFRKVCNHPELFERRLCKSPFYFKTLYYKTEIPLVSFGKIRTLYCNTTNPIKYCLPKLAYDEIYLTGF